MNKKIFLLAPIAVGIVACNNGASTNFPSVNQAQNTTLTNKSVSAAQLKEEQSQQKYVAVGKASLLTSAVESTEWVKYNTTSKYNLNSIVYATGIADSRGYINLEPSIDNPAPNNLYLSIGESGQFGQSSDGVTWKFNKISNYNLNNIAVNNTDPIGTSRYVFVGDNTIISSTPVGTSGIDSKSDFYPRKVKGGMVNTIFTAVAYDSHIIQGQYTAKHMERTGFVAVGFDSVYNTGELVISGNGVDWSGSMSSQGTYPAPGGFAQVSKFVGVAASNEKFVALTDIGEVVTSVDSVNWVVNKPKSLSGQKMLSIHYLNGIFIATGKGVIATSDNGLDWDLQNDVYNKSITDIIYNDSDHKYTAVASDGSILTSNNALEWKLLENNTKTTNLRSIVLGGTPSSLIGLDKMPDNQIKWRNSLENIPGNQFGLYGVVLSNKSNDQLELINVAGGFPTKEFSFDLARSTCFINGTAKSIKLAPIASCSLVVRYQPTVLNFKGTLKFAAQAKLVNSTQTYTTVPMDISYSSRSTSK